MDAKYVLREIDNECWPIELNISATAWQQIMSQLSDDVWNKAVSGVNITLITDIGRILKDNIPIQMYPDRFKDKDLDIIYDEE